MSKEERQDNLASNGERVPYRVRLPGFITDEEVGLGDVITRATHAMGITPCGGCTQRAAVLNSWVTFSGRRQK